MAVINAVLSVFLDAEHTLCYYHLQESLYSWIKQTGWRQDTVMSTAGYLEN